MICVFYLFLVVAIEYPVWCWQTDVLEITVDHVSKPPHISFLQTGFLLEIVAPVNVTLVSLLFVCLSIVHHFVH